MAGGAGVTLSPQHGCPSPRSAAPGNATFARACLKWTGQTDPTLEPRSFRAYFVSLLVVAGKAVTRVLEVADARRACFVLQISKHSPTDTSRTFNRGLDTAPRTAEAACPPSRS